MKKIKVYILTHKKFDEEYDKNLYEPLLNGSALLNEDFGYTRDDSGENISKLNPYYAELTGEYWVWKNSDADIIGFNHYRRWFCKNIKFDKLTKKDILHDLENYDIIIPQKSILKISHEELIKKNCIKNPDYGIRWEDEIKIKQIMENNFPEYFTYYEEILNAKERYGGNMFICDKKLADDYFVWLFDFCRILNEKIDFSKYSENNKRIFGFISERLLQVFVLKNNLKVKEHYVNLTEAKFPFIWVLAKRFPTFNYIMNFIGDIIFKF